MKLRKFSIVLVLGLMLGLTAGVVFNLLLLASFKYADFLVSSLLGLASLPPAKLDIVLPLGISFFTFQQISYLVDLRRGAGIDDAIPLKTCGFDPDQVPLPPAVNAQAGLQGSRRGAADHLQASYLPGL